MVALSVIVMWTSDGSANRTKGAYSPLMLSLTGTANDHRCWLCCHVRLVSATYIHTFIDTHLMVSFPGQPR